MNRAGAPTDAASTSPLDYWRRAQGQAARARLALLPAWQNDYPTLDDEFPNLLASFDWLYNQPAESAALAGALEQLAGYLHSRGHHPLIVKFSDALAASRQVPHDQQIRLRLLWCRAQQYLGDWQAAGRELARLDQDAGTSAAVQYEFGRFLIARGDTRRALRKLRLGQSHCRPGMDDGLQALIRAEFGNDQINRGRPDLARREFEATLQVARELGDRELGLQSQLMLGVAFRRLRDYDAARTHLDDLLARLDAERQPNAAATAEHHRAWVALNAGDDDLAWRYCHSSLARYRNVGDERGSSDALEQLGLLHLRAGDLAEAEGCLIESQRGRETLGSLQGQASALRHRATVAFIRHQWLTGAVMFAYSLWLYTRAGALGVHRGVGMWHELTDWLWGARRWTL